VVSAISPQRASPVAAWRRSSKFQVGRMREFRRAAEAAMNCGSKACAARSTASLSGAAASSPPIGRAAEPALSASQQFRVLLAMSLAAIAPGFRHALAQIGEAGQAVARRGEIGAAEIGRAVRREEHGQRPAAGYGRVSIWWAVW
jgi:hypothetical protein